jgi:hypothetical protein
VLRRLERAGDGVDGARRSADVLEVGRGLVDQALLAEEPEDRDCEQQGREQRQQRVVRQRRGAVGDLVLLEARERALEITRRDRRTGAGASRDRPGSGT